MKLLRKTLLFFTGFLCIASCIILVMAMPCARMVLDDFGYASRAHRVWVNTHSLLNVLGAAMEQIRVTYFGHQGSFIATFFHAFNGTAFREKYYFLSLFLHFGIFVFAIWKMTSVLFGKILKASRTNTWFVFFLILLFSVNFVPDTTDAFYAFNLCSMYTGFYDLYLLSAAFFTEYLLLGSENASLKKKNASLALACFFGFVAGGGHLAVVAMIFVSIAGLLVMTFLLNKNQLRAAALLSVFAIAGCLINAMAPGYHSRVENYAIDYGMSAFSSVFYSLVHSLEMINSFTAIYTLAVFVIVFILCLKYVPEITAFDFRLPALFSLITFGIFAAEFAPNYYAIGSAGYPRLTDMSYFCYYWLVISNMIYWIGWLSSRYREKLKDLYSIFEHTVSAHPLAIQFVFPAVFAICVLSLGKLDAFSAVNIGRRLLNGEAAAYAAGRDQWIAECENNPGADVIVKDLPVYFEAIDKWHVGFDPDGPNWVNGQMARYYQVKSFSVIYDED